MDEFKDIFSFKREEQVNPVVVWLKENLKEPYKMEAGRKTVTVICPSKDESFKVGQWIRYQNPLGAPLPYTVIGRDSEGRIVFRSACDKCRVAGAEPHYAHKL